MNYRIAFIAMTIVTLSLSTYVYAEDVLEAEPRADFAKADKELNAYYHTIMQNKDMNPITKQKLVISERGVLHTATQRGDHEASELREGGHEYGIMFWFPGVVGPASGSRRSNRLGRR